MIVGAHNLDLINGGCLKHLRMGGGHDEEARIWAGRELEKQRKVTGRRKWRRLSFLGFESEPYFRSEWFPTVT
jgi:hypothetical protein